MTETANNGVSPETLRTLAQPCLLGPVPRFGLALSFRIQLGAGTGTAPGAALGRVCSVMSPTWGMLGIGEPLARALAADVPGLRTFPSLSGKACNAPALQHALWILLRADDRSVLFDRSRAIIAAASPDFAVVDALDTFVYAGGRDLTGYEDGTENPKAEAAIEAALIAQGDGVQGGSFVAVQRWVHDTARFAGFPKERRDASIGRRIDDNSEIADAPLSSHVKRSAQESFDPPAFMLRRSMPWSVGVEHGLEFIAFGESLDRFERMLERMLGRQDGIVDALFDFSRPTTGAYYFCPPVKDAKLDLRALGL